MDPNDAENEPRQPHKRDDAVRARTCPDEAVEGQYEQELSGAGIDAQNIAFLSPVLPISRQPDSAGGVLAPTWIV